jgi:hypothetical protein
VISLALLGQDLSVFVVDIEYLVEHLVVDLRACIRLPIATAAVRRVPATRLAITLIAPLRDEHAAAAWTFAAAVLWADLAHDYGNSHQQGLNFGDRPASVRALDSSSG